MKVAIVTTGNLTDMKGIMNYVQEKMRLMQERVNGDFIVDNFFINLYPSPFVSWLHHTLKGEKLKEKMPAEVNKDGVVYHCINLEQNLIDTIFSKIQKEYIPRRLQRKALKVLCNYDVLATHQLPCHYIARANKMKNGVPYVATWHGSDIHTTPKLTREGFVLTKMCLESANMNFFVSRGLMETSKSITEDSRCDVLYTGASQIFKKYTAEEQHKFRISNNVDGCKVVCFVGNLIPVKNVMALPKIFKIVAENYNKSKVVFWVIGDGELEYKLKEAFKQTSLDVRFLGRKTPSEMPILYNCVSVNVLPSVNEGFSLVNVEARSCGVNVVGSNVGGIPEGIGNSKNCFALDEDFEINIGMRISEILRKGEEPLPLPEEMSWHHAIEKEIRTYRNIVFRR